MNFTLELTEAINFITAFLFARKLLFSRLPKSFFELTLQFVDHLIAFSYTLLKRLKFITTGCLKRFALSEFFLEPSHGGFSFLPPSRLTFKLCFE